VNKTTRIGCASAYHSAVSNELPPCGLYRTVLPIGGLEPGRLVYFHNHGNPGPGIYFPEKWTHNRAHFSSKGTTVPPDFDPRSLRALPAEGFYRVTKPFFCCANECTKFETEALVQLGYNGAGKALLFIPQLHLGAIQVPERGTLIDDVCLEKLVALIVPESEARDDLSMPRGIVIH
jgi:hypothetical protein